VIWTYLKITSTLAVIHSEQRSKLAVHTWCTQQRMMMMIKHYRQLMHDQRHGP
jgi:hypothetical protein